MLTTLEQSDDERVRLPRALADAAGFAAGADVEATVEGRSVVIRPRSDTLDALLDRIDGSPPPMVWEDVQPSGSDVW